MEKAESQRSYSFLADIPAVIDACGRFALLIIDRYPIFGMLVVFMMVAYPFYLTHVWASVKREEKKGDQRLRKARAAQKDKGKPKGKSQ